MKTILSFKSAVTALTLIFALLAHQVAWTSTPAIPDQTLRYAVTYVGKDAGELEVNIRSEENSYVVTSVSHLSNLASMFLEAHTSETRFDLRQGALMLDSGIERLQGNDDYFRSFQINRELQRVEYNNGETIAYQPNDSFEAVTFPLILMHRSLDTVGGTRVRAISTKRVRNFDYQNPVLEEIAVPAGQFTAWKITRKRVDRPDTWVTVWLNQGDNPIPVRIETSKKGKTTTLDLIQN